MYLAFNSPMAEVRVGLVVFNYEKAKTYRRKSGSKGNL